MKITRYTVGTTLAAVLSLGAAAAHAGDAPVRSHIHLGVPAPAPIVVHPHLVYPPVVYHVPHGYHHGHHYGHHRYKHHGKHYSAGHWKHRDEYHGYEAAHQYYGGHGWLAR